MPKFDGTRVDKLEFDFLSPDDFRKAAGLPDDAPGVWAGTTPEPSQDQVAAFFAALADIQLEAAQAEDEVIRDWQRTRREEFRAANPTSTLTDSELDTFLASDETVAVVRHRFQKVIQVRDAERRKSADRIHQAVAEFTSNRPGADVLAHLPARVVDGYVGWLAGQFSPEALAAAIKA